MSKEFLEQIHSKAVEFGSEGILIEEEFPNQLSTMEMFDAAEFATEIFRGQGKVAHVDQHLSDMELNQFAETVAVNRGLIVRVFNKTADAEKWLTG